MYSVLFNFSLLHILDIGQELRERHYAQYKWNGGVGLQGKKTPLYDLHLESGAKVVEFGGWLMPVQYSGIIEEHHAVRKHAGLFDVSHMGEFMVSGPHAETFINSVITNDVKRLAVNQILYSPMCYPNGGVVDDLLVYRLGEQEYLLVVNAGNIDKDFAWLEEQNKTVQANLKNVSDSTAELALQGPKAETILGKLTDTPLSDLAYYWLKQNVVVAGISCLVSRTGYTGEDGFELYCSDKDAQTLWRAIMQAGSQDGLVAAGLGARDTLRFEAALPLYGHELSPDITPLEAGLKPFVKLDKEYFLGHDALKAQYEAGVKRKIVGLEMVGRGIARAGYACFANEDQIGTVTSGSFCPTLGKNMALALLNEKYIQVGTAVEVDIRGKKVEAVVIAKPFYRRSR